MARCIREQLFALVLVTPMATHAAPMRIVHLERESSDFAWVHDSGLGALVSPANHHHGRILAQIRAVSGQGATHSAVDLYGDHLFEVGLQPEVKQQLAAKNESFSRSDGQILLTGGEGHRMLDGLVNVAGELAVPSILQVEDGVYISRTPIHETKGKSHSAQTTHARATAVLVKRKHHALASQTHHRQPSQLALGPPALLKKPPHRDSYVSALAMAMAPHFPVLIRDPAHIGEGLTPCYRLRAPAFQMSDARPNSVMEVIAR